MNRPVLMLAIVVIAIVAVSCGDDLDPATATPTSPRATPTPTVQPSTGISIVDEVTRAVATKDVAALIGLLSFWDRDGTLVVGVGYGESAFYEDGSPALVTFLGDLVSDAGTLHAILEAPTFPTDGVPGTYQVIYEPGLTISLDAEGITYLSFDGLAPAALIASGRFGHDVRYLYGP